MDMKKIILFFAVSFIASWTYGQGEMDAFKLSGSDLSGSARGVAMGGAFGALGGDITGISQNPAGIGVYRSSEVVTSLSLASVNTETNTSENIEKVDKLNFNFGNFAFIAYMPLSGDVKAFNFGFSYNRLKNFDRNYFAKGYNLTSSLTDYIAYFTTREANVEPDDLYSYDNKDKYDPWPYEQGFPWISVLGYNGGLIVDNGHEYVSPLYDSETVDRKYFASEEGYIDSYDFTMGANILDKLYLGLTVSLTEMRYGLKSLHTEEFELGGQCGLLNSLDTDGAGYQVSVGAIFRPIDEFRIGVAYHSPTWYNLSDFYSAATTERTYSIDDDRIPKKTSTPNDAATDYRFTTPDRWVVSFAGILGKKAIISLDYEYSDYSKMNLKNINGLVDAGYKEQNGYIAEDFTRASTLKFGLEYKPIPQLALRAGYSCMESPLEKSFKNGDREVLPIGTITAYTLDGNTNYYSYGAGFRFTPNFYMDLAFSFKTQTNYLYTYSPLYEDGLEVVAPIPSKFKNNATKGLLTLGYKF